MFFLLRPVGSPPIEFRHTQRRNFPDKSLVEQFRSATVTGTSGRTTFFVIERVKGGRLAAKVSDGVESVKFFHKLARKFLSRAFESTLDGETVAMIVNAVRIAFYGFFSLIIDVFPVMQVKEGRSPTGNLMVTVDLTGKSVKNYRVSV